MVASKPNMTCLKKALSLFLILLPDQRLIRVLSVIHTGKFRGTCAWLNLVQTLVAGVHSNDPVARMEVCCHCKEYGLLRCHHDYLHQA